MFKTLIEKLNVATSEEITDISKPKRSKGRPNIHPFAGRAYLLKDEINLAMNDKKSFVKLMEETYAVSDQRRSELGDIANPTKELSFTIHGPIIEVIDQLHRLRAIYGSKTKINISKERMVAPTHKLYLQPIVEVIGTKDNKTIAKKIFEEFRSDNIYGYVVIPL